MVEPPSGRVRGRSATSGRLSRALRPFVTGQTQKASKPTRGGSGGAAAGTGPDRTAPARGRPSAPRLRCPTVTSTPSRASRRRRRGGSIAMMEPEQLLERLSTTLRRQIGPAVAEPYPRTQAFMASVILEKLARQLRTAAADAEADRADRQALVDELRSLVGPTPPPRLAQALAAACRGPRRRGRRRPRRHRRRPLRRARPARPRALRAAAGTGPPHAARPARSPGGVRGMSAPVATSTTSRRPPRRLGRRRRGPHPRLPRRQPARRQRRPAARGRAAHRRRLVARDVAVRRHLERGRRSDRRQGFCLRRDPGNALLRELSDLGTQYRVLRLPGRHRRCRPRGRTSTRTIPPSWARRSW